MRSLTSGLVTVALSGIIGMAAIAGCSAEGAGAEDLMSDQAPTEPAPSLPAPSAGEDDSTGGGEAPAKDAGTKDSGKTDSGVDAGAPPPNPGDTCTDGSKIITKTCGACGKASARCDVPDGQPTGTVSAYGVCEGEKAGGCIPGTTQACGNCGTQTCTNACGWGTCTAQGVCKAGDVDYTSAGCTTAGTYSARTCSGTCAWGNYAGTCAEPINANKMTISTTVGNVVSADWTLAPGFKRVTGTCGSSTYADDGYPGFIVEVRNPSTTKTAKISAFHSKVTGGAELDTLISAYKKLLPPRTAAEYQACDFGIEDGCSDITNLCGNATPTGLNLAGMKDIIIPPGGKVLVYSVGYSSSLTGALKLNLKTDAMN